MVRYRAFNITLSVVCFAIVWSINENILALFIIPGKPAITWWVKSISAIGIFAFLFQLMIWASQNAIKKWFSEESRITGDWYQVFKIHNYNKSDKITDAVRHGPVSISFSGQYLEISATNNKIEENAPPSSWYSDKASLTGNQLWLLFSSTGPGRGSTHGNMLYHFQGSKPKKIVGHFADASPATHFGSIELYRDKTECEERVKQLISISPE